MGTMRKRNVIVNQVAMKMLEEGKIMSRHDWDHSGRVPLRSSVILRHFSNWARLVDILEQIRPDVIKELTPKVEPKVEPKKPKEKVEDPLAALLELASKGKTYGDKDEEESK